MCTRKTTGSVCSKLYQIPTRVIGTILVITQGILLNFFLANNYGTIWHSWIVVDIVIAGVMIGAYVVSYRTTVDDISNDEVLQQNYPLVFVTWAIYSIGYIARVVIIYSQFVWNLPDDGFNPNTLKFTMSISAPIFMLLLTAHYGHESKKPYVEQLTGTVVIDLLDSIQIMDVLIVQESRILLPAQLDHSIIAISCMNFIIPVVPLFTLNLNEKRPQHKKLTSRLLLGHKLVHMFVINVPLMGLRLFLWHGSGHDISVFLMKNIIMIYLSLQGIIEELWKHPEKTKKLDHDIELTEKT